MISIHTPAQGVTVLNNLIDDVVTDFNPHSRTGSDVPVCMSCPGTRHFNPHSRTGSD